MTVQELVNKLDSLTENERETELRQLVKMLTPVSHNTLLLFQQLWDERRPYEEFLEAQNVEIKKCIELEMSTLGTDVRESFKLKPLTPETIIT